MIVADVISIDIAIVTVVNIHPFLAISTTNDKTPVYMSVTGITSTTTIITHTTITITHATIILYSDIDRMAVAFVLIISMASFNPLRTFKIFFRVLRFLGGRAFQL